MPKTKSLPAKVKNGKPISRVTQRDIARVVGVSHVAVSHALHRPHEVRLSPALREEIERVAREMGYVPRTMTTHSIGLVVPSDSFHLDVTANIITHAHRALKERGYHLALLTVDQNSDELPEALCDPRRLDGIVIADWFPLAREIMRSKIPSVLLADVAEKDLDDTTDYVSVDINATLRSVVTHLHAKGHERIGLISGKQGVIFHEHVRAGFFKALRHCKLPRENGFVIHATPNAAIAAPLLQRLREENAPTAFITTSSGKMVIALNALQSEGFRVPKKISLLSLCDSEQIATLRPPITATTLFGREVVERAVEVLIERIRKPKSHAGSTPGARELIAGELIARESVAHKN